MSNPVDIFLLLIVCYIVSLVFIVIKEKHKISKEREEKEKRWEAEKAELLKQLREGRIL